MKSDSLNFFWKHLQILRIIGGYSFLYSQQKIWGNVVNLSRPLQFFFNFKQIGENHKWNFDRKLRAWVKALTIVFLLKWRRVFFANV